MTKSYVHWLLIIILKSFLAIRILKYKAFLKKKKKTFLLICTNEKNVTNSNEQ